MLSAKQYLYPRYGKGTKSTSGLTKHLNACTKEISQTTDLYKIHDDLVDKLDGDLKDRSQLLDETNYIIRDATDSPTERTPRNGLLANKSLSSLREEWFTGKEFSAGTSISDIKYNHPGLKHQSKFNPFNDQLEYALAHYFAESEKTKGNVNKFLSDPLMTPLTKKLSYKNPDE